MPFLDLIGHERPTAILKASILHDRVAHAYLFFGEDRIGKRLAALRFAQAINCEIDYGPGGPDACGACRSCRQIEARTHPDFLLIEPDQEQANPQIKIEQIRELEQQLVYHPLVGRRKVCLIDEADRMTPGAANALLKTLEEPPDHSLLLLITSRPSALLATVRSRCQGIRFVAPARADVETALKTTRRIPPADARFLAMVTQGRIGQALETDLAATRVQQDEFSTLTSAKSLQSVATLLTAAEALYRSDRAPEALEWIVRWIRDLILVSVGADPDHLLNRDRLPQLEESAHGLRPDALLDLLADIETIQQAATRNVNLQMALETILLRLRDAIKAPTDGHLAR
ncbi:MAG: DNA polymerase III subunit delta' [Nitrospirae bacterium 13_1_20CM_2_62_14]|nr:MAG: DNA polymerase III subunit delta' [Nitrospirae bacterium 13_1_40CM_2_62_10]OLE42185.1 MAG: DNA polymerase III subunit delta' [Nitrospirae bacterium 13_1_20CM_2_62_14]